MGAGKVTTRGHDAPVVSADDHWNIAQLRPVAFLYGGVESVAVEMGDGEAMKLLVPRDVRRPTGRRAGFDIRRWLGVAVTAQSFHGTIIGLDAPRAKISVHSRAGGSDPCGLVDWPPFHRLGLGPRVPGRKYPGRPRTLRLIQGKTDQIISICSFDWILKIAAYVCNPMETPDSKVDGTFKVPLLHRIFLNTFEIRCWRIRCQG